MGKEKKSGLDATPCPRCGTMESRLDMDLDGKHGKLVCAKCGEVRGVLTRIQERGGGSSRST